MKNLTQSNWFPFILGTIALISVISFLTLFTKSQWNVQDTANYNYNGGIRP